MSCADDYCNSKYVHESLRADCFKISSLLWKMLEDLEEKEFLRPSIRVNREEQMRFLDVMNNVLKISTAFNSWFDIYVEKDIPNSKNKLKKIMKIGEFSEENLLYILFSQMISVFLLNIEELRSALLYVLKLPIKIPKDEPINKKSTLNQLFKKLKKLEIENSDEIYEMIDCKLRNGLSHSLFWFERKDGDCSEFHLHYSHNIEFSDISPAIKLSEFHLKTIHQTLVTNCFLNVVADWFD